MNFNHVKKLILTLTLIATAALQAANYDIRYLQENAAGKIVERTMTVVPGQYLQVDGSGQLQMISGSALKSALTLNNVENTALSTWAGSTSITTLGTIATGSVPWSIVTSRATTLSGYGITDAQPLDSDLTAIAALTTTSTGRSLLSIADAAAGRAALTLGNVENTALSTWAGSTAITTLGTIATGSVPWSLVTTRPTTLSGYGITDAQPLDSDLTAIAALTTTSTGRGLLEIANQAAGRTALGATTVGSNLFTLTNPGSISIPLINADHSVTATATTGTGSIVRSIAPVLSTSYSGTPASNTALNTTIQYSNNAADGIGTQVGILGKAHLSGGTGGINLGSPSLIGVSGEIYVTGSQSILGGLSGLQSLTVHDGSGTLASMYGVHARTPAGSGPITTAYGVYAAPQARSGVGTSYGFYSAGAADINYINGSFTLNGSGLYGDAAGDSHAFRGTVTAQDATTASASSVLTRSSMDDRMIEYASRVHHYVYNASNFTRISNGGTVTSSFGGSAWTLAATSANNSEAWVIPMFHAPQTATAGSFLTLASRWSLSFTMVASNLRTSANTAFWVRMGIGASNGGGFSGSPGTTTNVNGVGFSVLGGSITPYAYAGSLATGTPVTIDAAVNIGIPVTWRIDCTPVGGGNSTIAVSYRGRDQTWKSGGTVSVASTTDINYAALGIGVINNGTGETFNATVLGSIKFVLLDQISNPNP